MRENGKNHAGGAGWAAQGRRVVTHADVESALRRAQGGWSRLRGRRALLRGGAAIGFAAALACALGAARLGGEPGTLLGLAAAALLAASTTCLAGSRRARARLDELQEDVFTLHFLRDTLEHERGPNVLRMPDPSILGAARGAAAQAARRRPGRPRGGRVAAQGRLVVAVVTVAAVAAALLLLLAVPGGAPPAAEPRRWTFLDETADPAALGFAMPTERAGLWLLSDHAEATGARALVNLAGHPDEPPATAIVQDPSPRDMQLRTRCKVSPERPHRACGVVFRHLDAQTYYVARVDAVARTVTLAVHVGGAERVLSSAPARVDASTWQELVVHARADHFVVSWNGRPVIDARDATLAAPGAVGLWAPADCIAYFDELTVHPLAPTAHPTELLPLLL